MLLSPRNVVTSMPQSYSLRTPFGSQRVQLSQTLLKSARQHFYHNLTLTKHKMSYKRSLPVRSEISVLFLNNLTADRMYCCHDPENFLQNVKTPLSQTPQTFFELFIQLLKFTQNFVHFQKNDQVHSSNIYEVIESEQCGDLNAPKILF